MTLLRNNDTGVIVGGEAEPVGYTWAHATFGTATGYTETSVPSFAPGWLKSVQSWG